MRCESHSPTPAAMRMPRSDPRCAPAVANHVALVWRVLRRTGLGPADAEDASQDVFWVLAQRFDDVPERAQRSFLVSTALRVASDRKLSKWHRSVTAGLDVEARVSDAPLPDEALELRRASALLDEALATLEEVETRRVRVGRAGAADSRRGGRGARHPGGHRGLSLEARPRGRSKLPCADCVHDRRVVR